MLKVIFPSIAALLTAIAWGIALRGEFALGGEMVLPFLVTAVAIIKNYYEEE